MEEHRQNPESAQPQSFHESNLVVVQSSLAAGLFGLIASLAFLAGYYYLMVVYQLGSPGKGLTATPWAGVILPYLLPVMFIGSAFFFLLYMFRRRTTSFDVREKTIRVTRRPFLGKSVQHETYRWDEVESVVSKAVTGSKGVVYHEISLSIPDHEKEVFIKRFNAKSGAASLRSEIAGFIGVPEKDMDEKGQLAGVKDEA